MGSLLKVSQDEIGGNDHIFLFGSSGESTSKPILVGQIQLLVVVGQRFLLLVGYRFRECSPFSLPCGFFHHHLVP